YLWTEFGAGDGWSWMQVLGRNSLMVYWVHVMLVYGDFLKPLKRGLSIPQTTVATLVVILLMIVMSIAWARWKRRRAERRTLQTRPVMASEPAKVFQRG
ncbi:MAG TPA: OpgC domain-containing protein, partial [Bryobacteraceae bacterium]